MTEFEEAALAFIGREIKKGVSRWANADATDRGEWRGKAVCTKVHEDYVHILGYEVGNRGIYDIRLDETDPMRFYSFETSHEYRMKPHLVCDLGSIPVLLQQFGGELLDLDPKTYWRSYGTHDSAYGDGGIWVRDPTNPASQWVFVPCERVFGDILLMWGLSAEGANNATLQAVYRAVRAGAFVAWRKHRKQDAAGQ